MSRLRSLNGLAISVVYGRRRHYHLPSVDLLPAPKVHAPRFSNFRRGCGKLSTSADVRVMKALQRGLLLSARRVFASLIPNQSRSLAKPSQARRFFVSCLSMNSTSQCAMWKLQADRLWSQSHFLWHMCRNRIYISRQTLSSLRSLTSAHDSSFNLFYALFHFRLPSHRHHTSHA